MNISDKTPANALENFTIASNLAGVIAHDFNNILTGILGNIELMQRRAKRQGIGDFNDYLQGANSAAARGVEFTQALLAIAGHQPLEPQRLATPDLIAQTASQIQSSLAPPATITAHCPPDLGDMICDPLKLTQALQELATHTSQAGADTLALSAAATLIEPPQTEQYGLQGGPYIAISLQHNGPGMSANAAAHAFEPYYTSQNADGLVLAKLLGLARQSGGHAYLAAHQPGDNHIIILLPASG